MRRRTSELIVVMLLKYKIFSLFYGCENDVQCDWIEHNHFIKF